MSDTSAAADEAVEEPDWEAPDKTTMDVEDIADFVDAYVLPSIRDRLAAGTGLWCNDWADHPIVFVRLMELALSRDRAVETEDGDPASWWVNIFDRHMVTLTAPDGPFRGCREGHGQAPAEPQSMRYDDVEAWFEQWFAIVLTRQNADLFWCPGWADHPEVLLQLTSLWAAWEAARAEPVDMLAWWDQAHRTLMWITAPDGPFAGCKTNRGHLQEWETITARHVRAGRSASGVLHQR